MRFPIVIRSSFCISQEELRSGMIEADPRRLKLLESWLSPKHTSAGGHSNRATSEDVDVIIIPKVVSDVVPKYNIPSYSDVYKKVSLMYIKARCDLSTLRLKNIKGESVVWADPLIETKAGGSILSTLKKALKKIAKDSNVGLSRFEMKPCDSFSCEADEWDSYISKVAAQFESRIGLDFYEIEWLKDINGEPHSLRLSELEAEADGKDIVVMRDSTVFAAHHIANLWNGISNESSEKTPLLQAMLLEANGRKTPPGHLTGMDISLHFGQMKNKFPLAESQRNAVRCSSKLGTGDVLAVSGPPGTGKTTMLQSIVADMVAHWVIWHQGKNWQETSPLILATSSNNKAITNIIDAFATENPGEETRAGMHERWLCYRKNNDGRSLFVPMAVYFPANTADKTKTKHYFISDMNGSGDYGSLRSQYFKDSSDFYRRANEALSEGLGNVSDIMEVLVKKLKSCYARLKRIECLLQKTDDGHEAAMSEIKSIVLGYCIDGAIPPAMKDMDWNSPEEIDRLLDLTIRYDAYWLAVHYNECAWIDKIEKMREEEERPKKIYGRNLLEEIRYVCPCIVATFFRMPKLFEFKSKKDGVRKYDFSMADMLIVDEAGQVSPEIGLPTFALSKKAIVVGDIHQIPPVQSVPENVEAKYWEANVSRRVDEAQHRLLSAASSSVMAIAQKRSTFNRVGADGVVKDGLFLNEHRRCVDEIISFSNELIYGGELLPKRGRHEAEAKLKSLPPMGIHDINAKSESKGGSRINREEVRAIREWILRNESLILTAFNNDGEDKTDLKDLINIITPFKAQSRLIQEDEYLRRFPSGTVHTFQGAESPIVIFSLVYGENDTPAFIMKNHELMNVAVSRAKDSFLVFGSRRCLELNQSDPACGLLYKKLEAVD